MSTAAKHTKQSSIFPAVPAPLQQLFDRFPLRTYPANELPLRSPAQSSLPTLYVFISERDALRGWPSFNPSCLKWQTFLRIAGVQVHIVPSTNHASPSGALPYLLPATSSSSRSAKGSQPPTTQPIPTSRLFKFAKDHATQPLHEPASSSASSLKQAAYQSLLDGPIRSAWLHALYLNRANTTLLTRLYLAPASSNAAVRLTLLRQLQHAAEAEILKSTSANTSRSRLAGGIGESERGKIYTAARSALGALSTLLEQSGTDWFFDAPSPGLFDASVFAYTQLLLDRGLGWVDRTLVEIVEEHEPLCRHRDRLLARLWGEDFAVAKKVATSGSASQSRTRGEASDHHGDSEGLGEGEVVGEALPLEESSYVEVER